MTIRLLTLVALLLLVSSVMGQTAQTSKTELMAIGSYAKSIDQFTKRNARKRRIFGIIPSENDQPDKWAEFKTVRQAVQANLFDSVYVWLKDGKLVAAQFSLTSSSGDWYHYVNYYFRADGTLAKVHSQLNTFSSASGGISVVREEFYTSSGKLLRTNTRYLDLKSQKPKPREDFMDQTIPAYQNVRDLPFTKLLRG
jgi:hypothetical protein